MTYEAPDLDFEMTYTVRTAHPLEPTVGSPFGAKQFWQVSEATLDGARIKAHLAGAGLDRMSVSSDGYWRPDVHSRWVDPRRQRRRSARSAEPARCSA